MAGLWPLALAPLYATLEVGQVYTFLCLIVAVAWLALRRDRSVVAGICLGALAAVKPNSALWPALLLLAGERRAALVAGATAAALYVLPLPFFCPAVCADWLAVLLGHGGARNAITASLATTAMVFNIQYAALGVGAVLCLLAALIILRRHPPLPVVSAAAIVAAIAVAPYSWLGYILLLLPALYEYQLMLPFRGALALLVAPAQLLRALSQTSPAGLLIAASFYPAILLALLGVLLCQLTTGMPRSEARRRLVDLTSVVG